jgi:hypothetical protein
MPAAIVLLVFGMPAAHRGGWGFDPPWIGIGFAAWGLSFLVGMLVLGSEAGRISRLTAERGAGAPEVEARIRRVFPVSRVELLLLLFVVFAMAGKLGR